MAESVTYSRIVELLDNSAYLAALKKAEEEEKLLAGLRVAGGQAAVKAYKATEAAAKQAAKETERAARGPSAWTLALQANTAATQASAKELADLRGQINLGAESLGKLGGALSLVSPELATLTSGLQKVTGLFSAGASGVQVLGSAFTTAAAAAGAVAVALSPLILLWRDHSEAVDASAKAAKIWNEVQDDGLSLIERSKASVAALALETSGLTDAQKAEQRLALDWQKQTAIANAGIDEQIRLIEAQVGQNAELEAINKRRVAQGEEELEVIRKTSPAYAAQTELLKNLRAEKARNEKAAADGLAADRKLVSLRQENTDVDRQLEQAEKDLEEAKKNGEKASKEAEKAEKQRHEQLLAIGESRERVILNDFAMQEAWMETLRADAEEQARIEAMLQKRFEEAGDAREKRYLEDQEAMAKANEERIAASQQTAAEISNAYSMTSDALGDYFDSVLDASKDKIGELEEAIEKANENGNTSRAESLKKQLAAEKEAATKAFEWQQTLSAANATVNWLEALVKATTYGPVGGPLVAGAATLAYGLSLKQIESQQPTFSDTPAGGYRMGPESQTVRGASNDTAILFRDPLEGFAQAVEVMARRQAPTSSPKRGGRSLLGVSAATTPVSRLLTRDVERATRGKL